MPIRSEINQAINPLIIEMEVDLESVFQKTIIGLAGVAVSITLNAMPITFHHLFPIFIALQNKYTHVASSREMVLLELSRRNQLIYRFHQFWEFTTDRAVVVVIK
jgi:hypothetical protein